jgi:hypothetical protein
MFEPERQARRDTIDQLRMSRRHKRPYRLFACDFVTLHPTRTRDERA